MQVFLHGFQIKKILKFLDLINKALPILLFISVVTLSPLKAFGMQALNHNELRRAVIDGKVEKVESLLNQGVHIPEAPKKQLSYLMEAANQGNIEIVNLLLKHGADPSHEFWNGWTALTFAAQHGYIEVVKLLLEVNPGPTQKHLEEALLVSAANGHPQTSKTLIKAGASVSTAGPGGLRPIHLSAKNGYPLTTKTLMEQGANINVQDSLGLTPMMWAAWSGNEAVVKSLLDMGADTSITDNFGYTAFYGQTKDVNWIDLIARHWSTLPVEPERCDIIAGYASLYKPNNQNKWRINARELFKKPELETIAYVLVFDPSFLIGTVINNVVLNEYSHEETGRKEWNAELESYSNNKLDSLTGQKRGLFIWSKEPVNPTRVQPQRKHLPWGMFPGVVQEAVDLNSDRLPDVLHVAYCCSDNTEGDLKYCEYYCTEYWIKKNSEWIKCKSSTPA